jgi:hypothetical protein
MFHTIMTQFAITKKRSISILIKNKVQNQKLNLIEQELHIYQLPNNNIRAVNVG